MISSRSRCFLRRRVGQGAHDSWKIMHRFWCSLQRQQGVGSAGDYSGKSRRQYLSSKTAHAGAGPRAGKCLWFESDTLYHTYYADSCCTIGYITPFVPTSLKNIFFFCRNIFRATLCNSVYIYVTVCIFSCLIVSGFIRVLHGLSTLMSLPCRYIGFS